MEMIACLVYSMLCKILMSLGGKIYIVQYTYSYSKSALAYLSRLLRFL